jgi:hypothetical protein
VTTVEIELAEQVAPQAMPAGVDDDAAAVARFAAAGQPRNAGRRHVRRTIVTAGAFLSTLPLQPVKTVPAAAVAVSVRGYCSGTAACSARAIARREIARV